MKQMSAVGALLSLLSFSSAQFFPAAVKGLTKVTSTVNKQVQISYKEVCFECKSSNGADHKIDKNMRDNTGSQVLQWLRPPSRVDSCGRWGLQHQCLLPLR